MRVVYLLNGTALYGGVKVVFQHACILRRFGVEAEVVSPEPAPTWFPEVWPYYRQVEGMSPEAIGPADLAVGTIYNAVPIAQRIPGAIAVHLCQSFEGAYEPLREQWPLIEEIYHQPTLKLTVSPHLATLIERRFEQPCTVIPQPLDTQLFSPGPRKNAGKFRVLVSGRWDLEVKGVERAMRALRPLAHEIELVRLTQNVTDEEAAFWPEAESHAAILPERVPDLLRSIDAYVSLSSEVEGFGLPVLEAMSCGRPSVVSDIGAHRAMDADEAATIRVPFDDAEAVRAAVVRLRDDAELRERLGREGRKIALTYSEERTGRALVAAFQKACGSAGVLAGRSAGVPAGE